VVFEFTHDHSIVQRWPFGLSEVTTKIVVEPSKAANSVESYWVVRSKADGQPASHAGAIAAEVWVHGEFPGGAFEPVRGADYELVVGDDRNGATTTEIGAGRLVIRVPQSAGARQTGFVVRARFLGDSDGGEPPKSLLVEIVRIRDVASGRELPLGPMKRARWLIVDPG